MLKNNLITLEIIEKFMIDTEVVNITNTKIKRELNSFLKNIESKKLTIKSKFILYFIQSNLEVEEDEVEPKAEPKIWITPAIENQIEKNKIEINKINNVNIIIDEVQNDEERIFTKFKENPVEYMDNYRFRKFKTNFQFVLDQLLIYHTKHETKSVDNLEENLAENRSQLISNEYMISVIDEIEIENEVSNSMNSIVEQIECKNIKIEMKPIAEVEIHSTDIDIEIKEIEDEDIEEIKKDNETNETNENKYILEEIDTVSNFMEELFIQIESTDSLIENVNMSYDDGENYDSKFGIYYYSKEYTRFIIENKIDGVKRYFQEIYSLKDGKFKLEHRNSLNKRTIKPQLKE